jgi:ribonuclease Z
MTFEVLILGSGAALPTSFRNPSSQYVNCNNRHILIDCAEGTQHQLRKHGVLFQKIEHILISHLHGDHFFGLVGLLSTMSLLGRKKKLFIYCPEGLEKIIQMQLEVGHAKLDFEVVYSFHQFNESKIVFEDKQIQIETFPLRHRIPTAGFVIREKNKEYRILGNEFKAAGISLAAIPFFRVGKDYTDESGKQFSYLDYTLPPKKARSYAYCSDTNYYEKIISSIQGVTCLYHEATFLEKMKKRAKQTFHTTALEAATLAQKAGVQKLIIGHLSARYTSDKEHLEEATSVFSNTRCAQDGMLIIV